MLSMVCPVDGVLMCSVFHRHNALESFLHSGLVAEYRSVWHVLVPEDVYGLLWFDRVLSSGFASTSVSNQTQQTQNWVALFDKAVRLTTSQPQQTNRAAAITIPAQLSVMWEALKHELQSRMFESNL